MERASAASARGESRRVIGRAGRQPGLFDAVGIEVVAGRPFDSSDHPGAPRVALVNQTLVRRYFAGEDPLGRTFRRGDDDEGPEWTVVGVVADYRQSRLTDDVRPEIIFPYSQNPLAFWVKSSLVVATEGAPLSVADELQQRLWELELAMTIFAVVALLLSSVGVYGIMS